MNLTVFGLGYVGCVSVACLSRDGHRAVGVDTVSRRIDAVNAGIPTIHEQGLAPIMQEAWEAGRVRAVSESELDLEGVDVSMVCVGTPPDERGMLNCRDVFRVAESIGKRLTGVSGFHAVFIRSTVLPGTVRHFSRNRGGKIRQEAWRRFRRCREPRVHPGGHGH